MVLMLAVAAAPIAGKAEVFPLPSNKLRVRHVLAVRELLSPEYAFVAAWYKRNS